MEVFNQIYIGKFNDEEQIAGVGLGNVVINSLTLSLMFGLNSAAQTFIS